MIRVLAVCILVDALAAVPAALITRHFLQRKRMFIDLVGFLVGTTVSILLALGGWGAWCMVWGFVASNVISGVLSMVLTPRRYGYGFSADAAGTLLRFGLPLAGSSAVVFLMLNADYVVVGRTLGGEQLGYYVLAFNVCSWPVSLVSLAVRRVSFAGFSRLADDRRVAADAFRRSAGVVLALSLPLCALLAFYAEPAISFLYGSKWLPSVDTLRVLCVLGAARIFTELAYDFLTAVNRSRENLWVQVLWVALLAPALTYGALQGGILGVAVAHAALALGVIVPCYLVLLRGSSVVLSRLAASAARPLAAVILVGSTSALVLRFVDGAFLQLALGGSLGLLSSVVLVRPMRHLLQGDGMSTAA
jgi:PST family polysaccharide transporter